jgi:actin-related protein
LLDSKTRKVLLPVPPLFPTRILTAILATLFVHFQPPSVTLMPAPILAAVAAGLRSALVVDIGWEETIVTPVYELRAIEGRGVGVHGRSRRGIKCLREKWAAFLSAYLPEGVVPDLNEVEEVMERLGYLPISEGIHDEDKDIEIPLAGRTLKIPFSRIAIPAENTFLAATTTPSVTPNVADDDDTPLPLLLYHALLHSAVDVRAACVSRIVFVGGGSRIPGLQKRVLKELQAIIDERGWILGLRGLNSPKRVKRHHLGVQQHGDENKENQREKEKPAKEHDGKNAREKEGEVRGVKSLGVWCGGSLIAGLKVKGKVEIERERFLNQVASGGTGLPAAW